MLQDIVIVQDGEEIAVHAAVLPFEAHQFLQKKERLNESQEVRLRVSEIYSPGGTGRKVCLRCGDNGWVIQEKVIKFSVREYIVPCPACDLIDSDDNRKATAAANFDERIGTCVDGQIVKTAAYLVARLELDEDELNPQFVDVGIYSEPARSLTGMRGFLYVDVFTVEDYNYHKAATYMEKLVKEHPTFKWAKAILFPEEE